MTKEELEEATDIIINSIVTSNINNYAKVELMINLKTFLSDYENNIKELKRIERRKSYEKIFK